MKKPIDKIDENRYRFIELYEFQEQKTVWDFLFAILGFSLIGLFAWLASL